MPTNPYDRDAAPRVPWRVSLHGGHSNAYCAHATSNLRSILQAADRAGMSLYGITEHAPRRGVEYLYPDEVERGWDEARLLLNFREYASAVRGISSACCPTMPVLVGFEAEAVPSDTYAGDCAEWRSVTDQDGRQVFDYVVGSVHHVAGHPIDGGIETYRLAVEACGGLEALVLEYYAAVERMIRAIQPEVVGHLDLIKLNIVRNGLDRGCLDAPATRAAVAGVIAAAADTGAILDVNTAGYRKGLKEPYPAGWIVGIARDRGVGMCFGDDSHDVAHVAAHLDDARRFLLAQGVDAVTALGQTTSGLTRDRVPLVEATSP